MQGAGGLVMNGTGTLLLSGTNYNAGAHTINAGTLKLAAANTLASSGALIINAGGTFDLNGISPAVAYPNGTGSILLGANTLTLTAAGFSASPGFSGTISGPGGVVVQIDASGVQTLGGNNTYTGGTTIKSGLVACNTDANLGAAAGKLTLDGGGLLLARSATLARPITLGPGGGLLGAASNAVVAGAGTLMLRGGVTIPAARTLTPGSGVYDDNATVAPSATLRLQANETLGSISDDGGTGGLIDLGSNNLTLNGDGACERCAMTTIDQATATPQGKEPLRTLALYRRAGADGHGVIFGQNVIPEGAGHLRVGDQVEVTRSKQ